MSITTIRPYGRIKDISRISPDISLSEIAVYGYLCYRAGSTGSCYPSQRRIADDLHMSWDALNNAAKHLISADLVTREKRPGAGRQKWSYSYAIREDTPSLSYGHITKRVIDVCRDLSTGAIGLHFALTSISGTSGDILVNREQLSSRLNINPKTLRKYLAELARAGEISTYPEVDQGVRVTRIIARATGKKPEDKNPEQTLVISKPIRSSSPTPSSLDEIKTRISREEYLSVDDCASPQEALNKQEALRSELSEIYHVEQEGASATYDEIAPQLKRFTRSGSRAETQRVVKTDMRYLLAFVRRFPRSWIADQWIRSAALETIFRSQKTDTDKIVIQQLFWILGASGDEQQRLINHLDDILAGRKDAAIWLASLSGRVSAALSSRPVQYPAAYARRMILNWLVDRNAQTNDKITVLAANDTAEVIAPVPQTFDDLVADPLAKPYLAQLRKLSRSEYRARANAYEAVVYERAAAGNPITRYDIAYDDDILDVYAVMPDSYYLALMMLSDPAVREAILALPRAELDRRAFVYGRLLPGQRRTIFEDGETGWLTDPAMDHEEAI